MHLNLPGIYQEDLEEFKELVRSAGAENVAIVTGSRHTPETKYFVGAGKAEEIKACITLHQAEIVLFNHTLTPSQEKNLESLFKCRVLDRTRLILDIFAQRARTFEGKLQVELAQLHYVSTRLVKGWTHFGRQGLRGAGETQLEADKRLVGDRIKSITKRLEKLRLQRRQNRRARAKAHIPTVSIVGYTNAGKSSLFNVLTASSIYTANQLFATLDPTLRSMQLPYIGKVILTDTVGFIRHLPHSLVDAFRATLEEIKQAQLLVHVIDVDHLHREHLIAEVNTVLQEIGASDIPQILVFNKIDLVEGMTPHIDYNEFNHPRAVWLSALKGPGIELLLQALTHLLGQDIVTQILQLTPLQGKLRAALYAACSVVQEEELEYGWALTVKMPRWELDRLMAQFN